jgi:Effector Associated Constant Component 1
VWFCFGCGVLAAVLRMWLRQSRADVSVEVRSTADETVVRVDAKRVQDVEEILRQVLPRRDGDAAP